MTFAIADEEENSDLFQEFGFDESSEEVNVGILGAGEKKYPMEPMEEFESQEVKRFLRTYLKGMLALFIVHSGTKYSGTFCFYFFVITHIWKASVT